MREEQSTGMAAEPARDVAAHPGVIVAKDLPAVFYDYANRVFEARGRETETGGMLVGEFAQANGASVFSIRGLIEAGPNADCSPESVLFDADYQARTLGLIRRDNPNAGNMGCIHVHPDQMDVCSQGDWLADVEAVSASDTKALVFAIVTIDNPRPSPFSVTYQNFKFDFFVLGQETAYQYLPVRPVVKDIGLIHTTGEPRGAFSPVTATGEQRHWAWGPRLLNDKRRLVAEVRAMEERYGGRAALRLEGNNLYWEYVVVESGRHFPIQVRYPRRYPLEPPRIVSLLPLPCSPHQMQDNELCWTNRLGKCEWNPARDTAAVCITAAHRWFACLLVYLTLGKWPDQADEEPLYPV